MIGFPCRLSLFLARPLFVRLLRPWVRCMGVSGRLAVDPALLFVIRTSLESADIRICTVLPVIPLVGVVLLLRLLFLVPRPRGRVLFLGSVLVLRLVFSWVTRLLFRRLGPVLCRVAPFPSCLRGRPSWMLLSFLVAALFLLRRRIIPSLSFLPKLRVFLGLLSIGLQVLLVQCVLTFS